MTIEQEEAVDRAAAIGFAWQKNSSLEAWFPLTADELTKLRADRDAWKAKAERTCRVAVGSVRSTGEQWLNHECGAKTTTIAGHPFCPRCGGRIVKEGQ